MIDPLQARQRVLLLQQAIYPYRRDVFDELNRHVDLTVLFCIAAKSFRRWDTADMANGAFTAEVMPSMRIGPFVVNRGLIRRLRSRRYDALIFGTIDFVTLPQVLAMLVAARLLRIPVIAVEEFFPTPWYMHNRPVVARLAILVRRFVYRWCDAFVVWNAKAESFVVTSGARADRVFSGPHWYPPPPMGVQLRDPFPGKRFILSIAYFLDRKGLDVLIAAFRRLPHDAILAIAGSGALDSTLRSAAEGDERVVFLGQLDESAKQPYLRHAYALVLPTLWDPWGLVANEGAYHGLPLVLTDAAGASDSLVKGNGFVVPAGDTEALTKALAALLDDVRGRDLMAANSRTAVARCTLQAMVRPVLAALQSVAPGTVAARGPEPQGRPA